MKLPLTLELPDKSERSAPSFLFKNDCKATITSSGN